MILTPVQCYLSVASKGMWVTARVYYNAHPVRMLPLLNEHYSTPAAVVELINAGDIFLVDDNGVYEQYPGGSPMRGAKLDPNRHHFVYAGGQWSAVEV